MSGEAGSGLTRWAVLLRGVNVGGHGKLPMAELREALPEIGATKLATYIQSGNLTFDHPETDPAIIAAQVSDLIAARFGFRPFALALTLEELDRLIAATPAPAGLDPKFIYLHLGVPVSDTEIIALAPYCSAGETLHPIPDGLAVLAPEGLGRSKLSGPLERLFKGRATARNLNSLTKFRDLVAPDVSKD
ncbi:DUF1697 domain-containing protein [Celeribacter neptunius]|uniref:Uncharacterized conserved protein, DUF1697 family n=1 Tax=Celeribacter neptunius TaxID=588602 RepID=A0A1I3K4S7_9RHOB|nr:DUF1697 domain-containing protein [Celeribacter neptunius]SFI67310.1 Uncharacterized conserved protein, DUF1697 family [Celeribacter neptunius]